MVGYKYQYAAAIAVAMLLGGLAVVQAGDPTEFGLSPVLAKWLGVAAAMLGILAGALPSWRKFPNPDRKGLDT